MMPAPPFAPGQAEQRRVLAMLVAYRGRSCTLASIALSLRLSRRDVEQAVQELRLAGEPLVSDSEGIRYTTDPKEVAACAEALRRRLVSQYLTSRALRRTARRLEGINQPSLWG